MANSNLARPRKQNIIEGGLILSLALLVIKLLGWYFRIALMGVYGATGAGYFNTVYNIYNMIYSLIVMGAPVAISRLVAQYATQGRYRDIRNLESYSMRLFAYVGLVGALMLFALSAPTAKMLPGDFRYYMYGIWAIAPSIFFCSLMSVYRGYNQGMNNMIPTALSQIVEVIVKVAAGLTMATLSRSLFTTQLQRSGTILGIAIESHSEELILALSAAGALLGVALSNVAGWIFLTWRRHELGDGIRKAQINDSPEPYPRSVLLKGIVWTVLPVALSSATASLSGVLDNWLILPVIDRLFVDHFDIVMNSHNNIFIEKFSDPHFNPANMLFGVYSMILTVMNLVPTITGSFGMSALPMISSSWAAGDRVGTKKNVETSIRICMLIAAPAGFGLSMLAKPLLGIIFRGDINIYNVEIGEGILQWMGMVAIVCALLGIVTAMFQAIGRTFLPLILTAAGLAIKMVVNLLTVSIPELNITIAPLGNLAGYTFICGAGLVIFILVTRITINIWGIIIKPLLAGAAAGLTAHFTYQLAGRFIGTGMAATAVGMLSAVIVYVAAVLLLRILEREDVLSFPKGEKLVQALERIRVLR